MLLPDSIKSYYCIGGFSDLGFFVKKRSNEIQNYAQNQAHVEISAKPSTHADGRTGGEGRPTEQLSLPNVPDSLETETFQSPRRSIVRTKQEIKLKLLKECLIVRTT